MKLSKIGLAVSLAFSVPAFAQTNELPAITVTAKPIIEETNIDAFSSTSALVTEEQLFVPTYSLRNEI